MTATRRLESAELELDEASIKWIQRIDGYFNGIIHLQGNFVQIDSQNQTIKGRFYVHRPGRLRFEYAQPSMLRIVSDGQYLSIEDHDLKTIDKYPLASTPFRMLLTENVDIIRDACIIAFSNEDDRIALTLRDRSGESPGPNQAIVRCPQSRRCDRIARMGDHRRPRARHAHPIGQSGGGRRGLKQLF